MLLTRVIPSMLYRSGRLVKGRQWVNERTVGNLLATAEVHMMRDVDELLLFFLDGIDLPAVSRLGDICRVPLTVGGGVTSTEDVRALLLAGADKVVVPHRLIAETAGIFGAQCAIACVDGDEDPQALADQGAGELIIQSRERDGMMDGYDLARIRRAADVGVPIVASSGAGKPEHMLQAIEAGASAVAAGAMWQFTHTTPRDVKEYLRDNGVGVRL